MRSVLGLVSTLAQNKFSIVLSSIQITKRKPLHLLLFRPNGFLPFPCPGDYLVDERVALFFTISTTGRAGISFNPYVRSRFMSAGTALRSASATF